MWAAAVLDPENRVVSTGYNGLPRGIPDDLKILADREIKLSLVLHAEENALLFARQPPAPPARPTPRSRQQPPPSPAGPSVDNPPCGALSRGIWVGNGVWRCGLGS